MCLILVSKVKANYGSLNTGVGIGRGGGGHRGQGPLNFCHRGQGLPKFWGYSVEDCVNYFRN